MSTSTARSRRHRARRAAGRALLTLELDELEIERLLIKANVLDEFEDHDHTALAEALARFLAHLVRIQEAEEE